MKKVTAVRTTDAHTKYVNDINEAIDSASKARGTGLAKRDVDYLTDKIKSGKGIIACNSEGEFVGFCYIESWGHGKYVANSGLIVKEDYRGKGVAKMIKKEAFNLSRELFPDSKIFGLTTGLAVMKINSNLGYKPVTFSELTDDKLFWNGCRSCINFDILERTDRTKCLCTAMVYDPTIKNSNNDNIWKRWTRWIKREK